MRHKTPNVGHMPESMGPDSMMETVARAIASSEYCVVLTGAGVSTESGIPDFRGPNGLWKSDEMTRLLSLGTLYGDPGTFYAAGINVLKEMRDKKPNPAHQALSELEKAGFVKAVITQNIDGLHQKAGSKRVIEIHGHLRTARCDTCGAVYPFEYMSHEVREGNIPPRCIICNGVVRPDIVFFDDPMPEDFHVAMEEAQKADFLLVVGSSLSVAPAAYLPGMAKRYGIVNLDATAQDEDAIAVIREKAGLALPRLCARIFGIGKRG